MSDLLEILDALNSAVRANGAEPLLYVVGGSRGNRINGTNSDYDVIGIHMHPDVIHPPEHRNRDWEVIIRQPAENVSVCSYEAWKYLELLKKGAFAAYEIRDLPAIFTAMRYDRFLGALHLTKSIPTSFAFSCTGNFKSDWPKDKTDRKKAVMACFRLCQAVGVLSEGRIYHNTAELVQKVDREIFSLPTSVTVLHNYMQEAMRKVPLAPELSAEVDAELKALCDWVEMTAKSRKMLSFDGNELKHLVDMLYQDRIEYYGR